MLKQTVYNIQHFRENVKSLLLTKLKAVYIPQAKAWGLDGTADNFIGYPLSSIQVFFELKNGSQLSDWRLCSLIDLCSTLLSLW